MSEENTDSKEQRRGCFGFLWRSALLLVTLIILGYQFENWRGARAWKVQRERIEKLGVKPWGEQEKLPLPPEKDNFCAIPELVAIGVSEEEGGDDLGVRFFSLSPSRWFGLPENRGRGYENFRVMPGFGFSLGSEWRKKIEAHVEFGEKTGWLSLKNGQFVERLEDEFGDTYEILIDAAKTRSKAMVVQPSGRYSDVSPVFSPDEEIISVLDSIGSGMRVLAFARIESGDGGGALDAIRVSFRVLEATMGHGAEKFSTHQGRYMFLASTVAIQAGLAADIFNEQQLSELAREISAIEIEVASLAAIDRDVMSYLHLLAVLGEGGWHYHDFHLVGISGRRIREGASETLNLPTWVVAW